MTNPKFVILFVLIFFAVFFIQDRILIEWMNYNHESDVINAGMAIVSFIIALVVSTYFCI